MKEKQGNLPREMADRIGYSNRIVLKCEFKGGMFFTLMSLILPIVTTLHLFQALQNRRTHFYVKI